MLGYENPVDPNCRIAQRDNVLQKSMAENKSWVYSGLILYTSMIDLMKDGDVFWHLNINQPIVFLNIKNIPK